MNGLAKLDIEQLRMVLVIAREMVPQRFGKRDMSAVFRLLNDCQALMPVLPAAIKWEQAFLGYQKERADSPRVTCSRLLS